MTKADIASDVARESGLTKTAAAIGVDAIIGAFKDGLAQAGRIELRGFGVLYVRARKRGIGRNPRTGDVIRLAPGRTVRFKPRSGARVARLRQRLARVAGLAAGQPPASQPT